MLERGAQKLRLDQLVIQQGRTQVNKGTHGSGVGTDYGVVGVDIAT